MTEGQPPGTEDPPTASSLKTKTVRSFIWKMLERVGMHGVQFVLQIFLARILAPEDFGTFAILLIVVNVANIIAQAGFNTALIQTKRVTDEDFSTVLWISVGVAAVLYCIAYGLAPAVETFFDVPGLAAMIRVTSLSFFFTAIAGVYIARLTRAFQLKKLFISTLTASVAAGVCALVLAVLGFGVWAMILQQIIFAVASVILLPLQARWLPRPVFAAARSVELFRFGWKILASSLLDVLYQGAYTSVIGRVFGTYQLGLYNYGIKFPQIACTIFDSSSRAVLLTTLSRLQHDLDQVKHVTRRAMKSSMAVVSPLMLFFVAAAGSIIPAFLGEHWEGAVPFMQIIAFSFVFWPMHTTNLQALNAVGKSGQYLLLEIIKKAIGIVILTSVLIVTQSIYFVALGRVLGSFLSVFVNAYPARKLFGYKYHEQFLDVLPTFLVSVVAAGAVYPVLLLDWNSWITLAVQGVGFFAIYGLASLVFRIDAVTYLYRSFISRRAAS